MAVRQRGASSAGRSQQYAVVVQERSNPSTDYFVAPALQRAGFALRFFHHGQLPDEAELAGAVVVFVRYVPRNWQHLIDGASAKPSRLVLFMDDDVLDVGASAGMPLRYRLKLLRLSARRQAWLQRRGAELWVSTPYLQKKYADWPAQLVLPAPIAAAEPSRRVFYHATASHRAEIEWLKPVMAEVLRRDERVTFEVVGGQAVYRLYRDVPRVTVVHPMKWPAYRRFLALPGRDIGLAPQLDTPFNRARSYTKFLDMADAGAVGVFASEGSCAEVVRHRDNGWLATMVPDDWVRAILTLVSDDKLRRAMLGRAQATVDAL